MGELISIVGIMAWGLFAFADPAPFTIVSPHGGNFQEQLAAKELRRYIYLRTKTVPTLIDEVDFYNGPGQFVFVGSKDKGLVQKILVQENLQGTVDHMDGDSYLIKSFDGNLLVIGNTPLGALYGAYRFVEKMGVGFYLDGDVVPENPLEELPTVDEVGIPKFPIRGTLPYHDFAEGPDWWNSIDYQLVTSQLAKLRFSFMGIHTYSSDLVEPQVWIGTEADENFAYPASMQTTARARWGYLPKATDDFFYGASQLYERSFYGSDVMEGFEPEAKDLVGEQEVFKRSENLIKFAFTHAQALGLKTAIGLEIPLWRPPGLDATPLELFKGIFDRIMKTYPLDYFWLWTPENWTWTGNSVTDTRETIDQIRGAYQILKSMGSPFQLATGGWVVGPAEDRALLDKQIPTEIPLTSLNRDVGFAPIDPAYGQINRKNKWASPWLEDDPGLTSPQLWVRRIKREVRSADQYNINGLFTGHWRTRNVGPQASALSKWSWNYSSSAHPKAVKTPQTVDAFYEEWARVNFGPEVARAVGKIFSHIDGDLPRTSTWSVRGGPGGIQRKHLILKTCRDFAYPDSRCPSGQGFASIYGMVDIGGWAKGTPVVEEQSGKLIIAARASGDKIVAKEWQQKTLADWYFIGNLKSLAEPKLLHRGPNLWVYAQGEDGFTYKSRYLSQTAWTAWTKTKEKNSEFGIPGPTHATSPDGTFEVSNPNIAEEFWFVGRLEALRSSVRGRGNLARFDYWLGNFRYMRAIGELRELMLLFDRIPLQDRNIPKLLALRKEEISKIGEIYDHLLSVVSTSGEMGTVANWEQQILPTVFDEQTKNLENLIKQPLVGEYVPNQIYSGPTRLIVPAAPAAIKQGADYGLKVLVLAAGSRPDPVLYWRAWGDSTFQKVAFENVGRGVYKTSIPNISQDFEYFVQADSNYFPVESQDGSLYQTVVVEPTY